MVPVQKSILLEQQLSPAEQDRAARSAVALYEAPAAGHLRITGADQLSFLHGITTNEVRGLQPDQTLITLFTTEKGRVIDRVQLLKGPEDVHLITSPGMTETLAAWLNKFIFLEDVVVSDVSEDFDMLYLFGPAATGLLSEFFGQPAGTLGDGHLARCSWRNSTVAVFRNPRLTVPWVTLLISKAQASALRAELRVAGEPFGLHHMGDAAWHSLRIESGWPQRAVDFGDDVNPHEARMLPFVNFDKGCYIGQEVIARLDTYDKVQKTLFGLSLDSGDLPACGDKLFDGDHEIGHVTSATYSFRIRKNIALCYVKKKSARADRAVSVVCADKTLSATLSELPFGHEAAE